jgi:phosphoserine phosphatase
LAHNQVQNGKYTGKRSSLISGTAKAKKIYELVNPYADVDWAELRYGDSFTDRHMMGLVGNPVAVYPDAKLLALSKEKNWEVLGIPKE